MAQKVWFTNDPVLMLNIDVEGDNKQVITRPATEQDKANYGAQLAQMQQGGGGTGSATGQATPGVAGQPGGAAQQSGQSGTTTREMQAGSTSPGATPPPAPSGATGQQQDPRLANERPAGQ